MFPTILKTSSQGVSRILHRNMGISAVLLQKTPTDPIQKLFIEKLKDYAQRSKSTKDGLVDVTPEVQKELETELTKVQKQYIGIGKQQDLTKFPTFNFTDPEIDPINLEKH